MKTERVADGYKCASCAKYLGQAIPDENCPKCGCMTAEVRYTRILIEENENVQE